MKKKLNLHELREMANAIRALSIDAIERAKSGHPGLPLGMADVITILYKNYLKFSPKNPRWEDRDRFILSAGHGSMLLYALGYLTGYKDLTINQIKNFRQLGSKTAGHPEYGLLDIIETTTGPLGQGLANSVGMAIAEKILNQKYGSSVVNHKTWVLVGDGCLMEGISQESISLAGHLNLNKLIVLFDDNGISIDGSTSLTTSDNQLERFKASNWNTLSVDGHNFQEIDIAFSKAIKSDKPTLISCKTIIGFGSPKKSGTSQCHGSPLGEEEAIQTKKNIKWTHKPFLIPENLLKKWRTLGDKGNIKSEKWKQNKSKKKIAFLKQVKKDKYKRSDFAQRFINNLKNNLKYEASRKSSQNSIEILFENVGNLIGGSADLTGSNLTKIKASKSEGRKTNYLYYGVREHLMAAAMNGISLHGGFIPYGGTFLIFSDYCKNAIRLSALMKQQVIYVMTHDSIGLGEDGPTHQPIEQLAGLRSIPNLLVLRPCDAVETFECWEIALSSNRSPSIIALSSQSLPLMRSKNKNNLSKKGAYFLSQDANSELTFIATGSEVSLAQEVKTILEKKGLNSNLVTMPSMELFDMQNESYKNKILGSKPRVIIEAASSFGWHKYMRENDIVFSIDKFGESGKGSELFDFFGFNSKNISNNIYSKLFNNG